VFYSGTSSGVIVIKFIDDVWWRHYGRGSGRFSTEHCDQLAAAGSHTAAASCGRPKGTDTVGIAWTNNNATKYTVPYDISQSDWKKTFQNRYTGRT